jgi:hypothetical protein
VSHGRVRVDYPVCGCPISWWHFYSCCRRRGVLYYRRLVRAGVKELLENGEVTKSTT